LDGCAVGDNGKVLKEDSKVLNKIFIAWGLRLDSKFVEVSAGLVSESSPYAVPNFTDFV
jgi:hypothetical protein